MKLERLVMLEAINMVKPALATKDLIEALTHIWFDGEPITAYNDTDLGIQVPFQIDFKGGLRGALLLGLLQNSRAKDIELEPGEEAHQMQLKAARVRAKLAVLDFEQNVWQFPAFNPKKAFKISADFVDAMKKVLVSVGNDTSIPEKLGVTLISSPDGGLLLFTTDSRSIAQVEIELKEKPKLPERIILPTAFCEQLIRICSDGGQLELRKDCAIAANADGVLLYARLVDVIKPLPFVETFAKHTKFPKAARFEVPTRLALALERAIVILDEVAGEPVQISISAGKLRLEAIHAGRGDLKDSVQIADTVPEITVKVAPDLIKRALPLSSHMVIGEQAIYMTGPDGFSYLASTAGG